MIRCLWLSAFLFACGGAQGVRVTSEDAEDDAAGDNAAGDDAAGDNVPEAAALSADVAPPAPMREILEAHSNARAEHCAPPLAWSNDVANAAAAWAEHLVARGCSLEHSRSAYGENLYKATTGRSSPSDVVAAWVNERNLYDYSRGGFSMETGHFTQVAWVGTTHLGCATRVCGGMELWVCNYSPPGNVQGGYSRNVQASCR